MPVTVDLPILVYESVLTFRLSLIQISEQVLQAENKPVKEGTRWEQKKDKKEKICTFIKVIRQVCYLNSLE